MKEIEEIASYVISRLKEQGIIIQRYNSITTNSVYLKLDNGVANSIRISDHRGKKHLAYRYNVLTSIKEPYREQSGEYYKYYYPKHDTNKMINAILFNRHTRIEQYGMERYKQFMESNKLKNKHSKGFWDKAIYV